CSKPKALYIRLALLGGSAGVFPDGAANEVRRLALVHRRDRRAFQPGDRRHPSPRLAQRGRTGSPVGARTSQRPSAGAAQRRAANQTPGLVAAKLWLAKIVGQPAFPRFLRACTSPGTSVTSRLPFTISTRTSNGVVLMRFSNWVKLDQRDELRNLNYPGVYAIAISPRNIAGAQFRWIKEISYFGFTNAVGGLRGRLNQFNNTLRDKSGPGHGGAQRFRRKYRDGNALAKKLYLAVCPFKCDVSSNRPKDLRVMGEVVRGEYLAFAKYVTLFGSLREFNDKEKSPKQQKL